MRFRENRMDCLERLEIPVCAEKVDSAFLQVKQRVLLASAANMGVLRLNNCSIHRPGGVNRPEDGSLSEFFNSL
jgi:hypothetical protein